MFFESAGKKDFPQKIPPATGGNFEGRAALSLPPMKWGSQTRPLVCSLKDGLHASSLKEIPEILGQDSADFIQLSFCEEIRHHPQDVLGNCLGVD
jgi:hypothetical protein